MTCDYCQSSFLEAESKCRNCGAPIGLDASALPDFRSCPACHRRLLALASPACSYCGRRLPDEYIKARAEDLKRITEVEAIENPGGLGSEAGALFSEAARRSPNGTSATLEVVDVATLIDFFS